MSFKHRHAAEFTFTFTFTCQTHLAPASRSSLQYQRSHMRVAAQHSFSNARRELQKPSCSARPCPWSRISSSGETLACPAEPQHGRSSAKSGSAVEFGRSRCVAGEAGVGHCRMKGLQWRDTLALRVWYVFSCAESTCKASSGARKC